MYHIFYEIIHSPSGEEIADCQLDQETEKLADSGNLPVTMVSGCNRNTCGQEKCSCKRKYKRKTLFDIRAY